MSAISKNTADLTAAEKRALLAQLLQKKASSRCLLPLSSGQQALWFLYELAPQSWAYNVLFTGRIRSHVDIPALRRAFQALTHRHPILRTTYTTRDGRPVQQVHEQFEVHFEETDTSAWSQNELNNRLIEEARRPFDLERGPVLRVKLFTVASTEHILLLTVHHIAVDFWSLTVLLDELRVLYPAQIGTQALLPPLDLQYTDYVRWQAKMLLSAEGEKLWAYWQRQLAGSLPVLNLPTDRPRPPLQTYRGASHSFKLSEELTWQLKALARAEEATLYMILLAAFQVLLHRYTGQEDILVGTPTTGRSRREFSGIVGDFINSVILRADLSENPTFKTFLTQVRHTVLAALKHQDYPFGLLVERLHPTQDFSRSPLFQVMLILRKLHRFEELSEFIVPSETDARMDFGGLELEPVLLAQQEGQFDLTLEMIEIGGSLCGVLKYNPDLFEVATIARMVEHFQTLVSGIVANPEQQVSKLPLLTAAEQYQLLVEWNDTQVEYLQDVCIHQLFEAQAKRTPEAIAVVFASEHLTYRELNARANQLAHYLQSLGVRPEVLVGICLERSLLMVVGILAILKAGGAYVPLDPAYPKERLAFMLKDAQVPVLLTQKHLAEGLSYGAKVVYLDSGWNISHDLENPLSKVTADRLAYVIYTSGSTGKPKGVQIPHCAVVNFLHSMTQRPGLTNRDVLLAVTSLSFDIAALELFLPLIVGAKVVVVSREVATDGTQLLGSLIDSGATALQATPATWRLLLEAGWQGAGRLKALCGGESLSRDLANQLLKRGASLWNLYGPTETTIWSTAYKVESQGKLVSIGRPIANTQIYLLDSHLQPVPIGVPGELHIGGAGLARGYLNRPDLTAQMFIPNPFKSQKFDSDHLYKTGDLARYLPDGNIECLGRIDHQVKIRGFRIELGEISAVLSQHPGIQETIVLVREDIPGNKRLVAYVVSHQKQFPTSSELRHFLKEQLPDYMVPSSFVMLETLPLTPNGKVDRRALPDLDLRPDLEPTYVAPQTEVESTIAKVWQELLGIRQVGTHDNFFELGGNSLLAVRLFAQIKKIFGKNLPLATLLQAPTVEQQAKILDQGEWSALWSSLMTIQTGGEKLPLFCVHGADGNILMYEKLARYLEPDQPVYGLQAKGLDGKEAPHNRFEDMAADYIRQIRTVQPEGPYLLAGFCVGGVLALEMAQQFHAQGQKVALLAFFDTYCPVYYKPKLFQDWVSYHLGNLLRLEPKEKLTYFLEGTKQVLDKISSKFYHMGCSLPQAYRKISSTSISIANDQATTDAVGTAYMQALRDYAPQAYQGRVILFRSSESPWWIANDLELGWGGLAAGGLEIHKVPGSHISIIGDNIGALAEKLQPCLDRA